MAEKPSAAQEALSKVEDQLQCPICTEPYTNPRLLACFHVCCQHCLQEAVESTQQQGQVTCPKCHKITALPPTGPAGLQAAFNIHYLFDIQSILKKIEEPHKLACEKCTMTTRQAISFCRRCAKFICEKCADMHREWVDLKGHEVVSIDEVKGDLLRLESPKKKVIPRCSNHDKKMKLFCQKCNKLICEHCILQLHKGHEVCVIADSYKKHEQEILHHQEEVEEQLKVTDNALLNNNDRCDQIARGKAAVETKIKSVIDEAHRALDARKGELLALLEEQTQLKLKNMSDQRERIEFIKAERARCTHFVKESIRTGSQGEVLEMKPVVIKHIIELLNEFSFEALIPGEQANTRFIHWDKLISQCRRMGKINLFMGNPAKSITGVKAPAGIAISKSRQVIVAEPEANCISVFSDTGKKIQTLKTPEDRMESPHSVAVDRGENILVADNRKLMKFSLKTGQLQATFDGKEDGPGQFIRPAAICANSVNGKVYITDSGAHCVHVFSFHPKFSSKFGSQGDGDGHLTNPQGIAADSHGSVYVADTDNNRIQVFTADGHYTRQFRRKGSDDEKLNKPCYICIDNNDLVYIAEQGKQYISVFTSEGEFIFRQDIKSQISAVTVDSCGVVYVCDPINNKIQFYE